jgi:hypothetical protein
LPLGQRVGLIHNHVNLRLRRSLGPNVFLSPLGKQLQPTASNFIIQPRCDHTGATAKDKMQVIREHRVVQAIEAKHPRQKLQTSSNSIAADARRIARLKDYRHRGVPGNDTAGWHQKP